jgi:glycosyltransferase involved in cell wall biosynthesis
LLPRNIVLSFLLMKFSIVIPCLNAMPYLPQCIERLLDNAQGLDVEIIVQDAGSQDGSIECAQTLLGSQNVFVEKDKGMGDAINRGWKKCTGDILLWQHADDYLLPGTLRRIHDTFQKNPEARWIVGFYEMVDSEGGPTRRIHSAYKNFLLKHYSRAWLLVENVIPTVSTFMRRDLCAEVGPIDWKSLANDYDYWLRLSKICPPLIIEEKLAVFRWHSTSTTGRRSHQQFKDQLGMCFKHTKNPVLRGLHLLFYLRNYQFYNLIRW